MTDTTARHAMTETMQPDPQGWFADQAEYGRRTVSAMSEDQRRGLEEFIGTNPDAMSPVLAALWGLTPRPPKPRTVADIPAGQGPASLFIAPFVGSLRAVYFKAEDGRVARVTEENRMRHEMRVLWDHLAATLPHVTAEEGA